MHASYILPHVSSVKSPQQIIGSLVKDYLCKNLYNTTPDKIYHVCVMPCYDKKLESSRKDFYNEEYTSKDVDCVLSTVEIEQYLIKENLDLSAMPGEELDSPFLTSRVSSHELEKYTDIYKHYGGGSGGYSENVLIYAAKHLFNYDLNRENIVYKQLKNSDFREMSLEIEGEVKLRFAIAYGFRNIQNIVQKIKKNNCTYHYIEMMACPSGCLNGGGKFFQRFYGIA